MVSSAANTVDEYLETLPSGRGEALSQLRKMIKEIAPDAEETMEYRMPTYRYGPGILCATASQKNHMSLYVEVEILDGHREALGSLNCGKGCIRFRSLDKLPLDTVHTILTETRDRLDGVVVGDDG